MAKEIQAHQKMAEVSHPNRHSCGHAYQFHILFLNDEDRQPASGDRSPVDF